VTRLLLLDRFQMVAERFEYRGTVDGEFRENGRVVRRVERDLVPHHVDAVPQVLAERLVAPLVEPQGEVRHRTRRKLNSCHVDPLSGERVIVEVGSHACPPGMKRLAS
jgi:hypothetical protein